MADDKKSQSQEDLLANNEVVTGTCTPQQSLELNTTEKSPLPVEDVAVAATLPTRPQTPPTQTPTPPPPPPELPAYVVSRFNYLFPGIEPITVLNVLESCPPLEGTSYIECLCLVYPALWPHFERVSNNFQELKMNLAKRRLRHGTFDLLYISRNELGDSLVDYLERQSPARWVNEEKMLKAALDMAHGDWLALETELANIPEYRPHLSKFIARVGGVFYQFEIELRGVRTKIEQVEQEEREQKRRDSLGYRERAGEFYTRQRGLSTSERWKAFLAILGGPLFVRGILVFLALTGAVTTVLATWKCTPPDTIPTIDSNFWSTITSVALGVASLFTTIIPILRSRPIKVINRMLFDWLLVASLITAVASMLCYAYQTRASLVILYVSSVAQLATTWLLIEGADMKIKESVQELEYRDEDIAHLESEIEFLRDR